MPKAIPLHRLNTPQTKVWLMGGELRRLQAQNLTRVYPGGVGVLSATQFLIAMVRPDGVVRELSPPFQRYEMWQIANAPQAPVCPCSEFFDPESGGPWKLRARPGEHHPICQFKSSSTAVFNALTLAHQQGNRLRPDEMLRAEERAMGKRGEKTRVTLR